MKDTPKLESELKETLKMDFKQDSCDRPTEYVRRSGALRRMFEETNWAR